LEATCVFQVTYAALWNLQLVNWQQWFVAAAWSALQAAQSGVANSLLGFALLVAPKSRATLPQ
jgi:hypothetical protein